MKNSWGDVRKSFILLVPDIIAQMNAGRSLRQIFISLKNDGKIDCGKTAFYTHADKISEIRNIKNQPSKKRSISKPMQGQTSPSARSNSMRPSSVRPSSVPSDVAPQISPTRPSQGSPKKNKSFSVKQIGFEHNPDSTTITAKDSWNYKKAKSTNQEN